MESKEETNVMGTGSIPSVLMKMGIPIICSMVLQACYNIVDTMFVSHMPDMNGIEHAGSQAVNALTLAFPFQMLLVAFGIGTGVGVNALLSRCLGQNNKKRAAYAAGNIILDPIMIYGLIGCPAMGIAGAAAATVIGQILSLVIALYFQYFRNREIPAGIKYFRLKGSVVKDIYSIGVSAIIMQALMSVMTFGVNIIFHAVSEDAVTAYGIFYKIQQFVFFAAFGIRDAMTPLISYNYGLGSQKRVREGVKYGIIYTEVVMLIGIVIMEIFARPLARAFGLTSETEQLCAAAMRIIAPGFIFAGLSIAGQGVFQALQSGNNSLIVSLLRLLIVVLPLCYLFTLTSNPEFTIWFAFPLSELAAAVVAVIFLKMVDKKKVEPMSRWNK